MFSIRTCGLLLWWRWKWQSNNGQTLERWV